MSLSAIFIYLSFLKFFFLTPIYIFIYDPCLSLSDLSCTISLFDHQFYPWYLKQTWSQKPPTSTHPHPRLRYQQAVKNFQNSKNRFSSGTQVSLFNCKWHFLTATAAHKHALTLLRRVWIACISEPVTPIWRTAERYTMIAVPWTPIQHTCHMLGEHVALICQRRLTNGPRHGETCHSVVSARLIDREFNREGEKSDRDGGKWKSALMNPRLSVCLLLSTVDETGGGLEARVQMELI